ncbi:FHA domain-containing protein [Nocardioides sp. BP30]|uniref:FHA domain-containing protein n=1 Tax=Nocardioides sp. BP30 TaxID=3036374 RepID=UPI0024689AE9|nr:FHA domain-containing protein [Nocardioides sp. BP30]WGL53170.1 FHA domain-containing protein [Nocardioides sp. BP30]
MISYRPGTWFGIVGEHATVLLPPSEKARAGSLWALVDDGAGFDEVLDALVSDGLRALPGFVLLTTDESTTRIVVRGPSKAAFATDAGEVVVEGSASSTWVERSLSGVSGFSVVLEDVEEPLLTLHDGLVRLAALVSPGRLEPAPGEHAPSPSAAASTAAEAPEVSGPYAAVLPFPAGGPSLPPPPSAPPVAPLVPPVAAPPAPPVSDPFEPEAPAEQPVAAAQPEPEQPEPEQPEPEQQSGEPAAESAEDELDVPAWASASAASDPLSGPVDPTWDESWADEPTGVIPVVPAEQPTAPEHSAEPPAWTPGTPGGPAEAPGAVPPPPPFPPVGVPPVPEPPAVPSWGAVPAEPAEPEPAAPAEPAAGPHDDHDGLTRAGAPDAGLLPPPPGIPGQQAAPAVTAYPVAKLEFSHGERVDVDRVVIIGRAPEAGRFSLAEQPLLVTVPSPHQEISSTHIEIRPGSGVDHGAAVVTDLGSTNGTVVVQPGLGPEELRPGVPVQLMPGALIDLGDGLTIRVSQP